MLSKITSWRHSKIIAFVLAVAVFLTAFYGLTPVISLAEATDAPAPQAETVVGTWDGTKTDVATAFADQIAQGVDGSEANPYKIYNGTQLYAAVHDDYKDTTRHFVLQNDIQLQTDANLAVVQQLIDAADAEALSAISVPNTMNNWFKDDSKHFYGHLDGNGYTVYGVYGVSNKTGYGSGFIDSIAGSAAVKNLTLDTMYFQGVHNLGGIAGLCYASGTLNISGCKVTNTKLNNTTTKTTREHNAVSGIIAGRWLGTAINITNCVVDDDVKLLSPNTNYIATLSTVDGTLSGTISNCISAAPYPVDAVSGSGSPTFSNTFAVDGTFESGVYHQLTADQLKGAALPGINATTGWEIKAGETPRYTGVIGSHPVDTKVYWNGFNIVDTCSNYTADGKTAEINSMVSKMEGAGTSAEDPKKIYYGYELYAAVNCTTDTYFKLMNDVQLQVDSKVDALKELIRTGENASGTTFNNWMTDKFNRRFIGEFDGNFKTVSHMYLAYSYSTESTGSGLFGIIGEGATVKNVTLDTAYIRGNGYTAGIVGYVQAAGTASRGNDYIIGCCTRNSRILSKYNVAGIVASGYHTLLTTIENCSSYDNIIECTGSQSAGAIQANFWSNTNDPQLKNSFSSNVFKTDGTTELNARGAGAGSSTNVSQKVATNKAKGAAAYNMPTITPARGWVVLADDAYPVYVGAGNASNYNYILPSAWNGGTVAVFAGSGTDADPYLISTGAELYAAVKNTGGYTFKIINDIKLQSDAAIEYMKNVGQGKDEFDTTTYTLNSWQADHSFKGKLIGNNHTIYGLYYFGTGTYAGLIGKTSGNVTVEGVNLESCYVKINKDLGSNGVATGILAGILSRDTTVNVTNCSAKYSYFYGTTDSSGLVGISMPGGSNLATCNIDGCVVSDNTISTLKNNGGFYSSSWQSITLNIKNSICVGVKTVHSGATSIVNTLCDISASSNTASNGSKAIVLTKAQLLSGVELPGFDVSTGWKLEEGKLPEYIGVVGAHKENTTVYWNGYKTDFATAFADQTAAGVDGSINNPYKIYYAYQLYAAVTQEADKYFKLMNNVQLQSDANMLEIVKLIDNDDETNPVEGTTFNDWGKNKVIFKGHLDGNFKTVSGLYINNNVVEGDYGLGFISRAAGSASIDNLTLDKMYVTGKVQIGGFVGIMYGSSGTLSISGCVLKNSKLHNTSTTADAPSGKEGDSQYYAVAGIIGGGWTGSQTITNTALYDNTLISVRGKAYGLVDVNNGMTLTVSNCIVDGYAPRDSSAAYKNVVTTYSVTNVGAAVVTKEQLKSGEILPGIRPSNGWELKAGEYPVYTGVIGTEATNVATHWNGVKISGLDVFESGTGTAEDPYIISHGFELYAAVRNTDSTKHFKLVNDIYLNDVSKPAGSWTNVWAAWQANTIFSGTIDGDGYTIYGLYEPSKSPYDTFTSKQGVGLIPSASTATIKNLHLREVYVFNCYNYQKPGSGSIIGVADNVIIDGCSVGVKELKNNHTGYAGGFIGQVTTSATIKDSLFTGGTLYAKNGVYGAFVGKVEDNGNVTLTRVVANGYKVVGNDVLSENSSNVYTYGFTGASYAAAGGLKYELSVDKASLTNPETESCAFYYDYYGGEDYKFNDYAPQLKNRRFTQNLDIDGDSDQDLDANDALALKHILLADNPTQYLTLSDDNVNGYNDLAGVDITDLVALATKKN